jgi:hypothetical protein
VLAWRYSVADAVAPAAGSATGTSKAESGAASSSGRNLARVAVHREQASGTRSSIAFFYHITQNWRGKPLRTFETVVELIGNTRTQAGLRVKAKLDTRQYSTGIEVTKAEMHKLSLRPHSFHGEWNYQLQPRELTR